jgi:cyclomaltodextrinase / maltogenic alpha-amylase / neopullulanase
MSRSKRSADYCRLAVAVLLVASPVAATESFVAFGNSGGDAWTFQKVIEAAVVVGQCDDVVITSEITAVTVQPRDGRAIAQVPLRAGDNPIDAACIKNGARHGAPARQNWFVRLREVPKARASAFANETRLTLDAETSELAPVRAVPIVRYEWRARRDNPAPIVGLPAQGSRVVLLSPQIDGEYFATLRVIDALGRSDESTLTFRVRRGIFETVDVAHEHSAWVDRAIVYGVVPSLFGTGGFRDITGRLDQLLALGINTLWLSPITAALPNDFGYAVTDHFRVRASFGSESDLHALVDAAHARGMRVVFDFVPNHLSEQHAYFVDAQKRGRLSPYFDFFARTEAGDAAYYFGWKNLKNLNYDNPEVQSLIIEAFAYWVREFDIDGFRADAAWGPHERAPEFWPRWRAELKRIKPDLLLLAEASAREPFYVGHGFDAAYDWTDRLGEWAWRAAFDEPLHRAARLRTEIEASSKGGSVFRFLNNNDTGARFVTRYGLGDTRVAAAMLLTLPGLPGLYAGDEIGAAYEPYRDLRPIDWNDPFELRPWYRRLIALRHASPALQSPYIRFLDVPETGQLLAYIRPAADPAGSIAVILNFGSSPEQVILPHQEMDALAPEGRFVDLLRDEELVLTPESSDVSVPPHSARILKAKP